MTKAEFRRYLYSEPLEPKSPTPEEREGQRLDSLGGYDAAGRKLAKAMLEWAEKSETNKKLFLHRYDQPKYKALGLEGVDLSDIPELKEAIDDVGPTGFMFGWAVQSARWLLSPP